MLMLSFIFVGNWCSVDNPECLNDLYPQDRAIIFNIMEENKRAKLIKERNKRLPICPIEPATYWNLECA